MSRQKGQDVYEMGANLSGYTSLKGLEDAEQNKTGKGIDIKIGSGSSALDQPIPSFSLLTQELSGLGLDSLIDQLSVSPIAPSIKAAPKGAKTQADDILGGSKKAGHADSDSHVGKLSNTRSSDSSGHEAGL